MTIGSGCSTLRSPINPDPIPPHLLVRCEALETAQADDPREVLRVHVANTQRARLCANRHATLVEVLETRR